MRRFIYCLALRIMGWAIREKEFQSGWYCENGQYHLAFRSGHQKNDVDTIFTFSREECLTIQKQLTNLLDPAKWANELDQIKETENPNEQQ